MATANRYETARHDAAIAHLQRAGIRVEEMLYAPDGRMVSPNTARMMAARDARLTADKTPCGVCGRAVRAYEAKYRGKWRLCPECLTTTPATIVNRTLDREDVTEDEARQLPFLTYSDMLHPADSKPVRPWSWVPATTRTTMEARLTEIREALIPRPNDTGHGCAMCGVREALQWHAERGFAPKFADDTPGRMCGACWDWWDLARRPHWSSDGWRWRAARAIAGSKVYRETVSARAYFEVADGSEELPYSGVDIPWGWVPPATRDELAVRLYGDRPTNALNPDDGARAHAVWRERAAERHRQQLEAEEERRREETGLDPLAWTPHTT